MLALGGNRRTIDVDIVVILKTLSTFIEAAQEDPRVVESPVVTWTYHCQAEATRGISMDLEFLAVDGGFLPKLHERRSVLEGYGAGPGGLQDEKAKA